MMEILSRPKECINAGCVACCSYAEYEFLKGIFLNDAQKCPHYERGMIPMSVIEDIQAEIEDALKACVSIEDNTEKSIYPQIYSKDEMRGRKITYEHCLKIINKHIGTEMVSEE